MFGDIGPGELFLIFLVFMLFFGAKRLPDLAGSLGKSIREFKKGMQETQEEPQKGVEQPSTNGAARSEEKTPHAS